MNFTLHLTNQCNLRCRYCTSEKSDTHMSEDVLRAACDLAFSEGRSAGLCFFGGEPLLRRDLIALALDDCTEKSKVTGIPFHCKMTTNGTLLDADFLQRAVRAHMGIGLSFEGLAQDVCRTFPDGSPSGALVEQKAKLLLSCLPLSHAMMTIAPEAVPQFAESVRYLHRLGFQKITATPAYGPCVHWTDADAEALHDALAEIAEYYSECFRCGRHFYFSPFDAKIRECITGRQPSERCHHGLRQMPVAPDGRIYACTQFIGDADYCLGDVFTGLDFSRQKAMAARHRTPEACLGCDLRSRCLHTCGCLNRLETGDENRVSSFQCTYERMLIALTDAMADRLFEEDPAAFRAVFVGTTES